MPATPRDEAERIRQSHYYILCGSGKRSTVDRLAYVYPTCETIADAFQFARR